MPSVTLTVAADATTVQSPAYGAGAGNHLPIGTWSGWRYRTALRFNKPSWATWTEITKATLSFYISDHYHVGVVNGSFYCRRTSGTPWTASEGSSTCESMGSANTTQYDDLVPTSTDQVSWSSGTTANAKKSLTVTNLVKYYWGQNQNIVFILDQVDSSDYTELWSRNTSYDATLTIEYVVQSVPSAPTLVSPAANEPVASQTPTFQWTHVDAQNDPQTAAEVELSNFGGTVLATYPVTGTDMTLVCPDTLNRGDGYKYRVRTSDAGGWGAWSALRDFTIRNLPVVTINPTREMVFASGAPRLVVRWTCDQTQQKYRVRAGAFDSGWIIGTTQSYTLTSVGLTDGVAVPVYVDVEAADALQGTGFRNITPRYGLTTHSRDLGQPPVNWETPTIIATTPTGASLVIEYGSNSTPAASPTAWYSSISSVPKQRYLYWRAWFIPSATASPTLDRIVIPVNSTVVEVDHWYGSMAGGAIPSQASVDTGEYVYGTRSLTIDCDGSAVFVYSEPISLRASRSYIISGLMKSDGASGARIAVLDANFSLIPTVAGGTSQTEIITETRNWYTPDELDTYRYRSGVFVAPNDMTVWVVLTVSGPSGAKAWWDAIKLEESSVATPWSPGAVGASIVDAGGVQIDGERGAVLRYKGRDGALRSVVEGGEQGLTFGTDTELSSPSTGILAANGTQLARVIAPVRHVYKVSGNYASAKEGLSHIEVEVAGAGGGGGGTATTAAAQVAVGGAGGGGGYSKKLIPASALSGNYAVTVGTGGTATAGGSGGEGGTSSFIGSGHTIEATGGSGGTAGSANANTATVSVNGGSGGAGSGGDVDVHGDDGDNGRIIGGTITTPVIGGGAFYAGRSRGGFTGPGGTGSTPGGGGGGATALASVAARAGGVGGDGVVIVTEYYS